MSKLENTCEGNVGRRTARLATQEAGVLQKQSQVHLGTLGLTAGRER